MDILRWQLWDRLSRAVHLYTGMFLVPWMIVYALSSLMLNHSAWFVEKYRAAQRLEVEQEFEFSPDAGTSTADEQAEAILRKGGLTGPYRIVSPPDDNQLTLLRFSVSGQHRVIFKRAEHRVVIEKFKPANWYSALNNLHFLMGYGQSSWVTTIWAVIVDSVIISTLLWVITGVYIWARRPRKRLAGGLCLVTGCAVFAVLVALLFH